MRPSSAVVTAENRPRGQGAQHQRTDYVYIERGLRFENKLAFKCAGCKRIRSAARYACTVCPIVNYCQDCIRAAPFTHPEHPFERITLHTLIQKAYDADDPPPIDHKSPHWIQIPRGSCPTCFDYRPGRIDLAGPRDDARFDETEDGRSWPSQQYMHISDLRESMEMRCDLCSLLFRGLQDAIPVAVALNRCIQIIITPKDISIGTTSDEYDGLLSPNRDEKWHFLTFHAVPGIAPPWESMKPARQFSNRLDDWECFEQIRSWLRTCTVSHENPACADIGDKPLPKRLICIQEHDQVSVASYLHEATEHERGRYLALSHCWGGASFLTLTSANRDELRQGINEASLPKSFQDAITVARQLDIRFVWIDSLCIVQDDPHDWETEAGKMRDIYSDAYLVLIATSAPNPFVGFLRQRPPIYRGWEMESVDGSGNFNVFVQHGMDHDRGYTASRGWCLQENLLARRCILFGEAEVIWECNRDLTCECGSRGIRALHSSTMRVSEGSFVFVGSRLWAEDRRPFSNTTSLESLHEDWRMEIVPWYSDMRLTKRGDKLPALAGLAALMASYCKGQYLAGLWSDNLQFGLLWYVPPGSLRTAPSSYFSPSFSWASVDSDVKYSAPLRFHGDHGKYNPYGSVNVTYLGGSCETHSMNPFGAVSGGHIVLSGLVHRATFSGDRSYYLGKGCNIDIGAAHYESTFYPDTGVLASDVENEHGEYVMTLVRSASDAPDTSAVKLEVDLLFVADMELGVQASQPSMIGVHFYALLVLGLSPRIVGTHERVGILQVRMDPKEGERWVEQAETRRVTIV